MIARLLLLFMPLSLALKASRVRVTSTALIAIVLQPGNPSPKLPKS